MGPQAAEAGQASHSSVFVLALVGMDQNTCTHNHGVVVSVILMRGSTAELVGQRFNLPEISAA